MYVRQLRVKNFRSLKDVSIGDLSPLVILYGENDSGKSNILSFLEHVFKQKYIEEVTSTPGRELVKQTPSGFWRGQIDNFADNFYRNDGTPIEFSIVVCFEHAEIVSIPRLPMGFLDTLSKNHAKLHLQIDGRIEASVGDKATMSLAQVKLGNKVFYQNVESEDSRYLPRYALTPAEKRDVFEGIMGRLDNAFLRISPERFLASEKELARSETADLMPGSFKNWLFQASLDRNKEATFRQITDQFNAAPFSYGRISIARVRDEEIEAYVEVSDKTGFKLPVGRKGSGVQQILMILAYMAQSSSSLVGVEELEINLSPKSQSSIFNSLLKLVNSQASPISQVFITTHSPHLARRNEAQRRGVWMVSGTTQVKKPRETDVKNFFKFPQ